MDKEAWDEMPNDLKQADRSLFRDPRYRSTWYFIKAVEADVSRLVFVTGKGTCLDMALDRTYELRAYEVAPVPDQPGYFDLVGLAGQFKSAGDLAEYHGLSVEEITATKLPPSRLYIFRG